jgi:hypothetical protein
MTTKHFYILLFLVFSSGVFSQESTKLVENRINFNVQNSLPRYDGIHFSIRVYLTNNENVFLSQIEQINNELSTKFNLIYQENTLDENSLNVLVYHSQSKISIQTIKHFFLSKGLNVENIENQMFLK